MRRLLAASLPLLVLLSSCGIAGIGGKSKEDEARDFCEKAHAAEDAGAFGTIAVTQSSDELQALQTAQPSVDYMGEHRPDKIQEAAGEFVAAYDDLVALLAGADFDGTKVDTAALDEINARLDAAKADMATLLKNQCDIDVTA
jgi:hypothetical protein